eukprot:4624303-Pyramimonas_sp.AAC.1
MDVEQFVALNDQAENHRVLRGLFYRFRPDDHPSTQVLRRELASCLATYAELGFEAPQVPMLLFAEGAM